MKYIIVTPAYNEEKYVSRTIDSVIAQTFQPILWVIVDDGSTDQTARIVKRYANQYSWIKYIFRPKISGQSYYASNVFAIQEGIRHIQNTEYDYMAVLDADITLPEDYYQKIYENFSCDPLLGIASGNCVDRIGDQLKKHLYDRRSCAKAIIVFRKKCYEQIGGFKPLKYGGEDTCACFMARKQGWKAWAYSELLVIHNKPLGTGPSRNMLKIRFRQGLGDWGLAAHPLFMIIKCLRRCIKESPIVVGGILRFVGYMYGAITCEKRQISDDLVEYIRKEHLQRIFHGNRVPAEFRVNGGI
jgi:poly-beta-1,6-N-acetyl-D-glucosamine synthase